MLYYLERLNQVHVLHLQSRLNRICPTMEWNFDESRIDNKNATPEIQQMLTILLFVKVSFTPHRLI